MYKYIYCRHVFNCLDFIHNYYIDNFSTNIKYVQTKSLSESIMNSVNIASQYHAEYKNSKHNNKNIVP